MIPLKPYNTRKPIRVKKFLNEGEGRQDIRSVLTLEQQEQVMDEFEKAAFAGLKPDQYVIYKFGINIPKAAA